MAAGQRAALVLGATGGIGSETASALERRGWKIRALSRRGRPTDDASAWEWVKGDSMDRESIVQAGRGCSVIVHGVNPPGYRNWARLVVPMVENTIASARAHGARVLLPGTVYNYGEDALPVLKEESPQHAVTHKGKIRIALEQRLEEAARSGVRTLIVRFGDFFGPKAGGSWFSQAMVTPGAPLKSVRYPGVKGVGHDWAYLPDAGEVFAQLMEREPELEDFARFHFRGHWDADGSQMIDAIKRVTGRPDLPVKAVPWFVFGLLSPFHETMRELYAVRPLWRRPVELNNQKLVAFLGAEPHTPLDEAVRETLRGLRVMA